MMAATVGYCASVDTSNGQVASVVVAVVVVVVVALVAATPLRDQNRPLSHPPTSTQQDLHDKIAPGR